MRTVHPRPTRTAAGASPDVAPSGAPDAAPGTVLVLGATGRFGRHATAAFAAGGWHVRALARRPDAGPGSGAGVGTGEAGHGIDARPADVERRTGDVLDATALAAAADGADVIVNALNPPYGRWAREVPALTGAVLGAARTSGATVMLPGNVYAFGASMPARLDASVPDAPTTALGRVRARLEARHRAAADDGVRTIVVRAGDFVEGVATGNWFEDHVLRRAAAGRVTYPGRLDAAHAWAWLPDLGRAFAALAARRDALDPFHVVGFPGWTLTGAELVATLERALGRPLAVDRMPWPLLRLVAPFSRDVAGALSMRYLWERPHAIDGAELARRLPGFRATPVEDGLGEALARLGLTDGPRAASGAVPPSRAPSATPEPRPGARTPPGTPRRRSAGSAP